jgi:hypothetical protein
MCTQQSLTQTSLLYPCQGDCSQCHPNQRTLLLQSTSILIPDRNHTILSFREITPVEAGGEFAYTGILIKELCMSQRQHFYHSCGASIQTLDTIQLRCHLQLRRALWNTVVNTTLVLYHFKLYDYSTVRAQKRDEPAPDVRFLLQFRTLGKR